MKLTEVQTAEFWRGVEYAARQVESDAHALYEIRDGYIEARTTGTHGGRRIRPEQAKQFAWDFGKSSEALFMASERLAKEVEAGRRALEEAEAKP